MFGKQPSFLLLLVATSLWSLLCAGAPSKAVYVYRGDSRTPAQIQAAGGFLPKGQTQFGAVSPDISLFNHVLGASDGSSRDDDGYVSTSTSVSVAEGFVRTRPSGYVYKIHVAANMIDCIGTLGKYNVFNDEREYAALGGVRFEQIVSWKPWSGGKFGKEEANKRFDKKRFGSAVAGGVQYQLAGFPASHRAWTEEPWKSARNCKRAIGRIGGNLFKNFPKLTNPFKKTPAKPAPIDQAPAKQAPVKQTPGMQSPGQKLPIDAAPVQSLPIDKTPVDGSPIDKVPVDKAPVDKAPVDKAPVDKAPVDKAPGRNPLDFLPATLPVSSFPVSPFPASPVQDYPDGDVPAQDAPAQDAPAQDAPVQDAPAQDTPVQNTPALNTTVQDPPVQQLQSRACTASKSAFAIAKAYMASIRV